MNESWTVKLLTEYCFTNVRADFSKQWPILSGDNSADCKRRVIAFITSYLDHSMVITGVILVLQAIVVQVEGHVVNVGHAESDLINERGDLQASAGQRLPNGSAVHALASRTGESLDQSGIHISTIDQPNESGHSLETREQVPC